MLVDLRRRPVELIELTSASATTMTAAPDAGRDGEATESLTEGFSVHASPSCNTTVENVGAMSGLVNVR